MLRALVLALGAIAIAAGVFLPRAAPLGPRIYLIFIGAAIILGTAFERWRYHTRSPGGAPGAARWEPTGERFEDPTTGETMEVHYDRASGERRYVRAGEGASGK